MKATLINVGRNKVNKTIEIKKHKDVFKELDKHILSSDVELYVTDSPTLYNVVVGGFRNVGQVEFK